MSNSGTKSTPQECQICLETINNGYLLECTHKYCRECIKSFCESQKKREITPSCPLGMHEIKNEWLDNLLLEGDPANPPHHPVVQDIELPRLSPAPEERKANAYFCPGGQDGEGVVDYLSRDPTKAIGQCGHQFGVDCYQPWGANGDHRCPRQISLRVNAFQVGDNAQEEEHKDPINNVNGPKGGTTFAPRNEKSEVQCSRGDHTFGRRCREDYSPEHRFFPFDIGGEKYQIKKEDRVIAGTWHLLVDIIVWPQMLLLANVINNMEKPTDGWEVTLTFLMILLGALLSGIGVIITLGLLIIYPGLVGKRIDLMSKKIVEQMEQA